MNAIIQTDPSVSMLILRIGLAVTFIAHSSQQMFGWKGGRGLMGTVYNWKEKYRLPVSIGLIGVFTEFLGSFALLSGFLVRPAALALALFILVVIQKAHWRHGFFLARRPGEDSGIEYTMALFLMALAVLFGGGGTLSIDRLLS